MPKTSISAACVVFASLAVVGNSFAEHLDIEAYNIRARPKPGPVEEFQRIKELPPVPFDLPFDWGMDPFNDESWQSDLHKLRVIDPALAAGDLDYARDVFRDWQQWHNGREAPRSWGDQITGARAARLAYLLHSTSWRDRSLIELAEQHATMLQNPDFVRDDSNHGLGQLHGLAALCLDSKLRSCRGAKPFFERKLEALLRDQFIKTGVHRENSPGYHFYALDNLSRMSPLLTDYDPKFTEGIQLTETLRRAKTKTKWLVHPDLTTVQLGDSSATPRPDVRLPLGKLGCEGIRTYSEAPTCYMVRHFKRVGYVIVRSDWAIPAEDASMLFIQGGFFNQGHRHADDLSFEWFEQGRKILSDSGKYHYNKDKWRLYFISASAHNTIEVDGQNYSVEQEDTYGDATKSVQQTSRGFRIIFQVNHEDLDFWHRRQIDYRPGEELRIKDMVRSDRPRVYIQWHHFARAFELSGNDGLFGLDDGEMMVELETDASCDRDTKYRKIKGQREPRIQGWASVEDRERHERWVLGVECAAQNATFEARYLIEPMAP